MEVIWERVSFKLFSNQLRISFCIFGSKCKLFYRWPDLSGKRKVRATQSISLPNGKRFRNEYLNYGKCRRKHTADGFMHR